MPSMRGNIGRDGFAVIGDLKHLPMPASIAGKRMPWLGSAAVMAAVSRRMRTRASDGN